MSLISANRFIVAVMFSLLSANGYAFAQSSDVLVVQGHIPEKCNVILDGEPVEVVPFTLRSDLASEQMQRIGNIEFECNHQGLVVLITNVVSEGVVNEQGSLPTIQLIQSNSIYRADIGGYVHLSDVQGDFVLTVVNAAGGSVSAGRYRAHFQVVGQ